jgi:hypothetical protein
MRKLILISALLLASASAQAGANRNLTLAGLPTTTPEVTKPIVAEAPKPIAQVAVRLAQAATAANDAAPVQVQAPAAPAPVQAQAPVQTTAPAATTTTTTATTKTTTTESKPSKSVKKAHRESDYAKARRIAARYGVYW